MQVYLHAGANCLTRVVMSRDPALEAAQHLLHHRQPASGQHHHRLERVEVSRLKAEYVSQEA